MPFSAFCAQDTSSYDGHDGTGSDHHVNPASNSNKRQWHEMDFTSSQFGQDMSKPESKYLILMDNNHRYSYLHSDAMDEDIARDEQSFSSNVLCTAPITYPQSLNIEASTMEPHFAPSISDRSFDEELSTSPDPDTSLQSLEDKMCPLIAGQVDACQPSLCGPDAPCLNFSNLPPIEECTSVPCINQTPTPTRASASEHHTVNSSKKRPAPRRRISTQSSSSSTMSAQFNQKKLMISYNPGSSTKTVTTKLDSKQRAKQAHSLVERKYRENLNAKLVQLHTTLHNTQYGPKLGAVDENEDHDAKSDSDAAKFRKSEVLTDAMAYVNHTEVEMRHMENEITRLNAQVKALEKLVEGQDCMLLKGIGSLGVQAATSAV